MKKYQSNNYHFKYCTLINSTKQPPKEEVNKNLLLILQSHQTVENAYSTLSHLTAAPGINDNI